MLPLRQGVRAVHGPEEARRRDREEPVAPSRGPGIRRRGGPRRRPGCSTRSVCRTPASPRSATASCRGSCSTRFPVIASIVGHSVEEYIRVADRLRGAPGIVAVEVNISCPNLADRSQMFSSDPDATGSVVRGVRRVASQPVFTKLSPDVTDIVEIARAAVRAGTHGLSVMNTTLGMAIDTKTFRPKLSTSPEGCPAGDEADRDPVRVPGVARVPRGADHRTGRDLHRRPTSPSSCSPARGPSPSGRRTSSTRRRRMRILEEFREYCVTQAHPGRVTAPTDAEGRMTTAERARSRCDARIDPPSRSRSTTSTLDDAKRTIDLLADRVQVFKVGLQLFTAAGPAAVEAVHARRTRGVPRPEGRTTSRTPRPVPCGRRRGLGVRFLTDPRRRGPGDGAGGGRRDGRRPPQLLVVSVLTSLDEAALRETGVERGVSEQVDAMAALAVERGRPGPGPRRRPRSPACARRIRTCSCSSRACARPGRRPATRSGPGRRPRRSPTART